MKTISVEIAIIIGIAFLRMLYHAKDTRSECFGTVQLEPAPE